MPLDPSISLQIRPTAPSDPIESLTKLAQMRNLLQQGQLRQAQIGEQEQLTREHQLKNEETERAQKDDAEFNKTVLEAGSVQKALEIAPSRGVRSAYLDKRRDELNKQIEQKAKTRRESTLAEDAAINFAHKNLAVVDAEPDDAQQAILWDAKSQEAVKAGIMTPEEVRPYPGREGVRRELVAATTLDHVNAAAEEKRKADEATRKAQLAPTQQRKSEAEALAAEQKAQGVEPIQPKELSQLNLQEARNAQMATNEAALRKQGQQRVNIAAGELALRKQQMGFEQGGGVSPQAQLAAEGKMDPQTLRSIIRRNPGIVSQIKLVDPNFDEANIDNRYNTLKEFTSTSNSKAGGQVLALNTLIHHADLYQQAADALKNGSFTPGNKIYNEVSALFGGPAPQNAALVARFLAGETGKVATGGVPAEGEIRGILSNLSTSASPDQIKGAGQKLLEIAAGRATPLMERAKQAKIDNVVPVIGPDAKEILARHGFDPETMKPKAAAGKMDLSGVSTEELLRRLQHGGK